MRSFLLRVLAFLAGLFLFVIVPALLIPDNTRQRFASTLNDASKSKWITDVLSEPGPLDVGFFGASFVLQSIDPTAVEKELGGGLVVQNLAMPYVGRDLEYVMLREAVEAKPLKCAVLQLRPTEGRTPHPLFVELARKDDFLTQPLLPAFAPVLDWGAFLQRQGRLMTPLSLLPKNDASVVAGYTQTRGFKPISTIRTTEWLDKGVSGYARSQLPPSLSWIEYHRPRYYLKQIHSLCAAHQVRLIFLSLPGYKDHRRPTDEPFLRQMGDIIDLPAGVIDEPSLREDNSHFNQAGAAVVSGFVGRWLKEHLVGKAGNVRSQLSQP